MVLRQWCKDNGYVLRDSLDGVNLNRYEDGYSVTTVLQLLYDPKFDYILRNNKEAIEKACEEGTKEHLKVEKFFDAKSGITEMNPNFMKFISLYNLTPLKREETVYRKYNGVMFRGTIDCIGEVMYDNPFTKPSYYITNIDWKNSKTHSEKYLLQLAGYKWLNGYSGLLVYGKDKLVVKEYTGEYDEVRQELISYFIKLINETNK